MLRVARKTTEFDVLRSAQRHISRGTMPLRTGAYGRMLRRSDTSLLRHPLALWLTGGTPTYSHNAINKTINKYMKIYPKAQISNYLSRT